LLHYLILVFTDRCGGDGTKQPGLWLNKIKQFGTGKLIRWKDKLKNGGFGSWKGKFSTTGNERMKNVIPWKEYAWPKIKKL
jgi:hypothetical protein